MSPPNCCPPCCLPRALQIHDLLLTLASTAWESGRCSWVSSSHKHLGWCSGVRTSPVYLTPGLEELETDWKLRNWGWSQKNQSHQGKAVSSCNPACTTQTVNSHLKACQNCPDKTDFVLNVCFLPPLIISGAESLLTALVSITCWFNTSSTFSCWMQGAGCSLCSGQLAWKRLKLLRRPFFAA